MQDGDIQPQLFNNDIKGMGIGICQNATNAVLVGRGGGGGGGGKRLAKR